MRILRAVAGGAALVVLTAALTGCSIDALIWGPDGARVIQATEEFIGDLAAGEPSDIICDDSAADLGESTDWVGLSAGEPERFVAEYWGEQVPLDPQWSINLENLPIGAVPGDTYPGDVFYRETDEGFCVVDVVWWTIESVG
ncbi:hypothetical protein [Microbacterium sp.]|uniref:hypothetical protein n=1 Tax=Microbacterium sp. TaxID=51671 RepID=UPI003A8B451B